MTGMVIARGSRPHDAPAWAAALVALAVMGGGAARAAEPVIEAVQLPAPAQRAASTDFSVSIAMPGRSTDDH